MHKNIYLYVSSICFPINLCFSGTYSKKRRKNKGKNSIHIEKKAQTKDVRIALPRS